MACKDYCRCGMPLECMSSFSCAKRALSNRYQWMQAEGPVLLRHLRWPQPRLDFQPAQEGLLDDWTVLENWHQEGLYSHDHFTTYTAFRHLVEDHVKARGRAEGVRVGKNLKNGWLERGVESVLDKNLMLEARQKNLMDMPLEDPQWTTFRHKVRDCYERIYASLVGDGAVLNADGAESNLGIREADDYLSYTLRKGMMDQELTALVCSSYSSDEAWEGWEGLRALDDHFDQQMDQPQELDESLAGAESSGPTGASEPTATPSETLEDREFAEYCAVCYIGTRRHVARRSCKGPTKGTVHTSCLDCYYKLPILESLHNDIFEVAIDANKMSKRVGRCKTCKGCGGYLRDRNFQSCYIVGDAVLCMECTKNAQATTWPLPTERKSILLCEWCQTSVCNKTLFDCCPRCPRCEHPVLQHKVGCSLAPPHQQPSFEDDAVRGQSLEARESQPCNCQITEAEEASLTQRADRGLVGSDLLHSRDCIKRLERALISVTGPSLLIKCREPRDYLNSLPWERREQARQLLDQIDDRGLAGYVSRKEWLNITEGHRYVVGVENVIKEVEPTAGTSTSTSAPGPFGRNPSQTEAWARNTLSLTQKDYGEKREELKAALLAGQESRARRKKGQGYLPVNSDEGSALHQELAVLERDIFQYGLVASTAYKYGNDFEAWAEFCRSMHQSPVHREGDDHDNFTRLLLRYLTYNVKVYGNVSNTLRGKLAAIGKVHRVHYGLGDPTLSSERPQLNLYLQNLASVEPPTKVKFPYPSWTLRTLTHNYLR